MKALTVLTVALLGVSGGLPCALAELKPGANLLPYEIHNTSSGDEYCQMCKYSARPATVAAYGNLHDEAFWGDLEKLQKLADAHKNYGFFGQVLDSTDATAIQGEAKKHGIKFPVVYAVDPDWEKTYQVGGVSRTIYYSVNFKVDWSGIGLDQAALAKIEGKLDASS